MSSALSAIKVFQQFSRFHRLFNIKSISNFRQYIELSLVRAKTRGQIKIENKPKQNSLRQPLRRLSYFNSEENISTFVAICLSRVKFYE